MDDTGITKTAAKKRGRPRVHADPEAKALSDAERKRAKREKEATLRRDNWHNTFYRPELPVVLPQLPPMMERQVGHGQDNNPQTAIPASSHLSTLEEIEDFLPPASPSGELATVQDWDDSALELGSPARATALSDDVGSGLNHLTNTMPNEQLDDALPTIAHDISLLASRMTDQLMEFNGCCADCHQQTQSNHGETVELGAYLDSAMVSALIFLGPCINCPTVRPSAKLPRNQLVCEQVL